MGSSGSWGREGGGGVRRGTRSRGRGERGGKKGEKEDATQRTSAGEAAAGDSSVKMSEQESVSFLLKDLLEAPIRDKETRRERGEENEPRISSPNKLNV